MSVLRKSVLRKFVLRKFVLRKFVLRKSVYPLALLGVLAVPVAATAQSAAIRDLLKVSCTGDYLEHCSMHAPGGPEVEACFRANFRKLSPACAQAITAYRRQKGAR